MSEHKKEYKCTQIEKFEYESGDIVVHERKQFRNHLWLSNGKCVRCEKDKHA